MVKISILLLLIIIQCGLSLKITKDDHQDSKSRFGKVVMPIKETLLEQLKKESLVDKNSVYKSTPDNFQDDKQTHDASVSSLDTPIIENQKNDNGPQKLETFFNSERKIDVYIHVAGHECDPENCVPYHLCSENKTVITDGGGLLDSRFNPEETCHYLEVCCQPDKQVLDSIIPQPAYNNQLEINGLDDEKNVHKCGYRYKQGMGIQIKEYEHEAQYGEFPWMAAILLKKNYNTEFKQEYICGGSIIHPKVVLTAAHCIYDKIANHLKVRGGEWDTQTTNEHYPFQESYVKEVLIHEKFYRDTLQYDIALLFLKDPFYLDGNVRTVCLPPPNYLFKDDICYASGWGKDLFGKDGKYSVILKKRELPIIYHAKCESLLRKTRLGHHFNLHRSFLCAGAEKDKDMCHGDGGSPLVCPIIESHGDRYYQSGIVAWGIGCNDEKVPGVYVNVSMFRNWIDYVFQKYDYDTKYYEFYK